MLVFHFVTACGSEHGSDRDDPRPKWTRYGESVKIDTEAGNPLTAALNLLGLKPADLSKPRYLEAGYNMAGRFPLIDYVAESPFYLHHWADSTAAEFQQAISLNLSNTLSRVISTLNGGRTYSATDLYWKKNDGGIAEAYTYLCNAYNITPPANDLAAIDSAGFSSEFDTVLGQMLMATTEAARLVENAFAGLDDEERNYLLSRPERYFFPNSNQFNFLTAPTHVPAKVLPMVHKIDFISLYAAALTLTGGIDGFIDFLNKSSHTGDSTHIFKDGHKRKGRVLSLPSPIGNIVIMGHGADRSRGDAAVWIDLGGNDYHTGQTASGFSASGKVSLLIDIEGNDVYDTKSGRYAQGFGFLSIGMLIDLAGNDTYQAGNMAQGCGMFGVGLLMDLKGRDFYQMGLMGQGFGLFGTGLLIDTDGSDRYIIAGMGQGAGSTLGFGGLLDLKGNDKYLADKNKNRGNLLPDEWSHVQGAGLSVRAPDWTTRHSYYGGIGFLSDGAGDDFYYATDGNSMGSSYFMSIGALVDMNGSDKYISKNGYAMGFAVHLSNGILIDRNGDDQYIGSEYTGGVGSDRSTGLLVDYAGNDIYGPDDATAKALFEKDPDVRPDSASQDDQHFTVQDKMAMLSFGAAVKPKALGMLIDIRGDDRYYANPREKTESTGGVVPPSHPQDWSHAVLLDLSGRDFYNKRGRKDNHYHKYLGHGLSYDTEFVDVKNFAKNSLNPVHRRSKFSGQLLAIVGNSQIQHELIDLSNPDLYIRTAAVAKINAKGMAVVPDLVKVLVASGDNELNRDILEIINFHLLSGRPQRSLYKDLETLLKAVDPFVRTFAARKIGYWQLSTARPALVRAAADSDDRVRASVFWALGRVGNPENQAILIAASTADPSIICRRAAVAGLSAMANRMNKHQNGGSDPKIEALLAALEDADEIVRTFAAEGLSSRVKRESVAKALHNKLTDKSAYVVRASATSLILNGHKEGIPYLIETLQFPSIDTFEHYDQEIQKDLAYYCGIDFPPESRYEYETWHRWWSENSASVDLELNLTIMQRIRTAFEASDEEKGIAILDELRETHPDNVVVRNRYARFCYEWITYRLLTKRLVDEAVLKRCLRLQIKLTEIDPVNAGYWSRLAHFHARLSAYDLAANALQTALELEPENEYFQTVLKQYKMLYNKQHSPLRKGPDQPVKEKKTS